MPSKKTNRKFLESICQTIVVPVVLAICASGCQSMNRNPPIASSKIVNGRPSTSSSTAAKPISTRPTVSRQESSASTVQQVGFQETDSNNVASPKQPLLESTGEIGGDEGYNPTSTVELPIDLPTALQLAGADHLQIQLARERIREACAKLQQANVMWIPNINVGLGYNHHDGQIQDTQGNVLDVHRQSLYYGGGPALGSSPLSGGASGPARLFVDLPVADILFEPLAARQRVDAQRHAEQRAENDSLLQVGLLYQELVRAHLQKSIAEEAIVNATELVKLTGDFEEAGKGLVADVQRSKAELQQRRREQSLAAEQLAVTSAELTRLLRLDSTTRLIPVEEAPMAVEMIGVDESIDTLVAEALGRRPELAEHQAKVAETKTRIEQEQWRPWLPNLYAGYAGAGFGGGTGSDLQNFGYRGDLDVAAVWQVRNLGAGNRALVRQRDSQHLQAHLQFEWIRDQVIAEVAQAYARSNYRRDQIRHAELQVAAAADALPLNLRGIRDGVIRPIEAQQAIAALASARSLYLASVIDFNQAQLELTRAIGSPTLNPAMN